MKEIIFGTTNPGKIAQIQAALNPLGIKVVGIEGLNNLPEVEESGETAQENSRIKASAYAKAIGKPVLSMDNALYLDNLAPAEQPATHVRRIPGHDRANDEEMITYYSGLIEKNGGRMTGHWEFSICIAFPDGRAEEVTAASQRIFTSEISSKKSPGYPLESIQLDPQSGKYLAEMSKEEVERFWQDSVGKEIKELFSTLQEELFGENKIENQSHGTI